MHSGNKGKRFERQIAESLAEWTGLQMGRTPMSGAWTKEPGDIVCLESNGYFPFAVECKHQEQWTLDNIFHLNGIFIHWLVQAIEQAESKTNATGELYWPMLFFKRNRRPIYILIPKILALYGGRLEASHIVLKTESWGTFIVGEATEILKGISYDKVLEYHAKLSRKSNNGIIDEARLNRKIALEAGQAKDR